MRGTSALARYLALLTRIHGSEAAPTFSRGLGI
jgi:hypothetical protein